MGFLGGGTHAFRHPFWQRIPESKKEFANLTSLNGRVKYGKPHCDLFIYPTVEYLIARRILIAKSCSLGLWIWYRRNKHTTLLPPTYPRARSSFSSFLRHLDLFPFRLPSYLSSDFFLWGISQTRVTGRCRLHSTISLYLARFRHIALGNSSKSRGTPFRHMDLD